MDSVTGVIDSILFLIDDLIDFFIRVAGHDVLGTLIFFVGVVTVLWGAYVLMNKYYYRVLLFAAFGFLPAVVLLFISAWYDDFPADGMIFLYVSGILVTIPYLRVQFESYKAYKEKKPPPYKWTIVTLGLLSVIFNAVLFNWMTRVNILNVLGSFARMLARGLGL